MELFGEKMVRIKSELQTQADPLLEIEKQSAQGLRLGIIMGIAGIIPFLVHKIFVRREDCFNLLISNILIYLNIVTGIGTIVLSARLIA